jgi:hypothetical protein
VARLLEQLQDYEAVFVRMTSWLLPASPVTGDTVAVLAVIEAFVNSLLEIVLIATFTQRFFAR